jgi:hypothetical protein
LLRNRGFAGAVNRFFYSGFLMTKYQLNTRILTCASCGAIRPAAGGGATTETFDNVRRQLDRSQTNGRLLNA